MGKTAKVNMKNMTTGQILNLVYLGLLILVSAIMVICAFTVKPKHTCIVDGKEHAMEYEFKVGSRKLNGRTFDDYRKVNLCPEDLAKVKKGDIKLVWNKDTEQVGWAAK